jgi:glycosyltransferase involved in cell wall biosynthesis/ubiquinone/menaquinone biosynthesis C-methylase UbiE
LNATVRRPALRYVLPNLRLGGQVELVRSALTELRRRGFDADALLPPGVNLDDRSSLDRYAHARSWWKKASDLRSLRAAVRRLHRECFVTVVLPSPALLPIGRWLARGKRAIFHFEGDGATLGDSLRELFHGGNPGAALRMSFTNPRLATARRDEEIFVIGTEAAASRIAAVSGGARPIVLPQACDWSSDGVAVEEARMRLALPLNRPLVGYAGHPFSSKGWDALVEAFRIVRRRRPDALLVIASSGEGRRIDAAEDRINLGITDIPLFLRAIDVLALPYRTLASTTLPPSLLLEGMAIGVPIVASDLPDLREVAPDSEVAFVAAGSVSSLARAIEVLLERERGDEIRSRQKRRTTELQVSRSRSGLWDLLVGEEVFPRRKDSEATRRKAEHYDRNSVVRSYEGRRFGGPGGRYVENEERRAIDELLNGLSGSAVDLPSGTGRALPVLAARSFRVFSADGSIAMLSQARREGRAFPAIVSNAFQTPFRSESFDLVLTLRFFFHVSNPGALLREVSRLLRPDGYFVFDSLLWSPRSIFPSLQRRLGGLVYPRRSAEVENLLSAHGFEVKKTISLFTLPSQIYRYLPGFALPLARRIDAASSRGTKTFYLAWKTSSSE